jgi:hypothetical protein
VQAIGAQEKTKIHFADKLWESSPKAGPLELAPKRGEIVFKSDSEYECLLLIQTPLSYKLNIESLDSRCGRN